MMFTMLILIGLMSTLYLMQFTKVHTKGYAVNRLESEYDLLKKEQEIKYTNISRVKSLSHIQETNQVQSMIPAISPIFIKPDTALVLR